MATLTARGSGQVDAANSAGRAPVVFIHGLWLLASSWDRWATLFEQAGFAPVAPGWPDDPETVEEARANANVFAGKKVGHVADHVADVIGKLNKKPAVVGHSFGGLLAQIIAGRGLSAATVAIDPAPFRGVLPLPVSSLKSAAPVLGNPANSKRAVTLSLEQFKYGWANAVATTRRSSCTRRSTSRRQALRCSRPRAPTSIRGPRRRSTARAPTA